MGTFGPHALVRGDLDRAHLRRVQAPQGFRTETLLRAYDHHVVGVADDAAPAGVAESDEGFAEIADALVYPNRETGAEGLVLSHPG